MGVRQAFLTVALTTLGISLLPLTAHAISIGTVSSEAEFQTLLSQPDFVAVGQANNIALNTTSETDTSVDFAWSADIQQPFSLNYDGSTVRYTVGNVTLETSIEGAFSDLFLYTRATESGTQSLLNNLVLTDSTTTLSISGISAISTGNEISILRISDIRDSFTLTGNATLRWINFPQNLSNLSYQIQVGNVEPTDSDDDTENQPSPPPTPQPDPGIDWSSWLPVGNGGDACVSP